MKRAARLKESTSHPYRTISLESRLILSRRAGPVSRSSRPPLSSLDHVCRVCRIQSSGEGSRIFARVTPEGRISISLDLKNKLPDLPRNHANRVEEFAVDEQDYDKPLRSTL